MTDRHTPASTPTAATGSKRRKSRGQSVVEFAVILPILLGMLLVAADAGRAFTAYITVSSAAREGASFGSLSADNAANSAAIQNRVREEIGNNGTIWGDPVDIPAPTIQPDAQDNDSVVVTVSYRFEPWAAIWPMPSHLDMSRTVQMRVLGN